MKAATTQNEISYESYIKLGGIKNSDLQALIWNNGSYHYCTYHYVGVGEVPWKQDLPA